MNRCGSIYLPDPDSNVDPRKKRTPDIVPMGKPNPKYLETLHPRRNQILDVGPLENQTPDIKQVLRKADPIFLAAKT